MNSDICRHCRLPESEHHEFEALVVPDGCVCTDFPDGDAVRPICDSYAGKMYWCGTCYHDRGCHAKLEELTDGK